MATFPEPASPNFDAIRIIETNDPVLGGAAEIAGTVNSPVNYALRALVARTQWLRQRVEGISTPAASRATAGIARLASLAQVTAGQDDTTIVTPYLLQQKISAIPDPTPPDASTTRKGIVQLATESDVANQQNTGRVVTVDSLYTTGTPTETPNILSGLQSITGLIPSTLRFGNRRGVGNVSFFGPIALSISGISIDIHFRAHINGGGSFAIRVRGENFNDYRWTATATDNRYNPISVSVDNNTQLAITSTRIPGSDNSDKTITLIGTRR